MAPSDPVVVYTATSTPQVIIVQTAVKTPQEAILEAFDGDNRMVQIAQCESGMNTDAKGVYGEYGLFQILPSTWNNFQCTGDPMIVADNISCAKRIQKDGLHHWNPSRSCWDK